MVIWGLAKWQVNSIYVIFQVKLLFLEQITNERWGIPVNIKFQEIQGVI